MKGFSGFRSCSDKDLKIRDIAAELPHSKNYFPGDLNLNYNSSPLFFLIPLSPLGCVTETDNTNNDPPVTCHHPASV